MYTRNAAEETTKKAYVEPTLEKVQKIQDVTEGVAPVVTGAVPA